MIHLSLFEHLLMLWFAIGVGSTLGMVLFWKRIEFNLTRVLLAIILWPLVISSEGNGWKKPTTLKDIKDKYNQFWVYTPIGNMWVMALRLPKDDEFYETGFLRVDYGGLCDFKYWDDGPAIGIERPELPVEKYRK